MSRQRATEMYINIVVYREVKWPLNLSKMLPKCFPERTLGSIWEGDFFEEMNVTV
jgi:hypothetical protein